MSVIRASVPTVDPEDVRFMSEPLVVAVSAELDERFKSVPPLAITDVVWAKLMPAPVVRALFVKSKIEPPVVFAPVKLNTE